MLRRILEPAERERFRQGASLTKRLRETLVDGYERARALEGSRQSGERCTRGLGLGDGKRRHGGRSQRLERHGALLL